VIQAEPKDSRRIRKLHMQEDKAYDSLNDEMFPGLVFARITLYKTEPLLFEEDEVFKEYRQS
jgi:hypothetical protein